MYCVGCGQRIKRGQVLYATPAEMEQKACWCHTCYTTEMKGDKLAWAGDMLKKTDLVRPQSRAAQCAGIASS